MKADKGRPRRGPKGCYGGRGGRPCRNPAVHFDNRGFGFCGRHLPSAEPPPGKDLPAPNRGV